MAKKATRAVGYPWGVAEESARSVRWLCHNNIDGCKVLARYLEQLSIISHSKFDTNSYTPVINGHDWVAVDDCLSPLICGTAIADRSHLIVHRGITLHKVMEPALILFFAAQVARHHNASHCSTNIVSVQWNGCKIDTDGWKMSATGVFSTFADEVFLEMSGTLPSTQTHSERATPTASDWNSLKNFASRTYAPNTEQSRLTGAGAGLSDND